MRKISAKFERGITGPDKILEGSMPQVAFVGRSNVGKSSVINSLTNQKGLAITSSFPGRTQQINLFSIDESMYWLDLPGYGFAKASKETRWKLLDLIDWYLFRSSHIQKKVILIIDGKIGPTRDDLEMLKTLEDFNKEVVVVANKVDKIKKSKYATRFKEIENLIGKHKIIPYSSYDKIGISALIQEIFN